MRANTSKGYVGMAMEGRIATSYAKNTKKRLAQFQTDARIIAKELAPGSAVLEVAPGPGYLLIELARLGDYRLTGLDISKTFVDIAQKEARAAGVKIDFRLGNASDMPFGEKSFDFLVCRAAFKNFSEPLGALDEFHRVLRPGGRAVIIDLRADVADAEINQHVAGMGLNWLEGLTTKWIFKYSLKKRAYSVEGFKQLVGRSRFTGCEAGRDDIGLWVWLRK